ncbi:hypothetical protein ACFL9U_06545 [Thermodesulfobacteriota bacterium]
MKNKIFLLGIFGLCFLIPNLSLAQAPQQVGGFELGQDIGKYIDMLNMETAFPVRYNEFLNQVETKENEMFKSGLVAYGTCANPGRIVRVKLKYADSSRKFYKTLLKRFEDRFGDPSEYRGDSFQVVIAWKWSFTDSQNNRISLVLQHNTRDEEEKMGNAVKLTVRNYVEEESRCFEKRHPEGEKTPRKKTSKRSRNWDLLIPR